MKYLAILKDSLRETIDSKVFFVVIAFSALAIFLMATLTLTPNPPDEGLRKLIERFSDGSRELDVPILGKVKVTEPFTRYFIRDLKDPANPSRPWDTEYKLTIQADDQEPLGTRLTVLARRLKAEEEQEKIAKTGRKTRSQLIDEEIAEEARRIQEREGSLGNRMEAQHRFIEHMRAFITARLTRELHSLRPEDMEAFIRVQLEDQGNWTVQEVKALEVPEAERKLKLKARVQVKEGEDIRIKTEEAEGEVNRFAVTMVNRSGTYNVWPHKATLLFGAIPLGSSTKPGQVAYNISYYLVSLIGAPAIMLLSCIITAFYIPNMLQKGTIDLLLAKPIGRVGLLLYKYVGGLTFMFLNTTVLILGLWLVLGLRSGIWELSFLLMIPILTFEFALFYALSTWIAVWTRSPVACILVCVLMWSGLIGLGWGYWLASCSPNFKEVVPNWASSTAKVAHTALPHYLDMDWLADRAIEERMLAMPQAERERAGAKGYDGLGWPESLAVTSLYIVLLLGLAGWRFAVKDY